MANVMTFATRAAFDTALASGGSIAALMDGVTSAAPSVSIVAHITESGETFNCGTNIMYDIKSAGPGDYIVYDSTNGKYFAIAQKWIDNNYPAQPTQKICKVSTGVLPARFVVCGTLIANRGNGHLLIAGQDGGGLPWTSTNQSDYAWNVDTLTSYTQVMKQGGGAIPTDPTTNAVVNIYDWCAFPSQRWQENYFSSGHNTYLPITRSAWNTAIAGLSSADPTATITINVNGSNVTVCPFNYDYDYDKFVAWFYKPQKFPSAGCYADRDGLQNTVKIVKAFIGKTDKNGNAITLASETYAAGYCYNHSVSAPGLQKHQWYLPTIKEVGDYAHLTHTFLTPRAWHSYYYWSSTQYSAYVAWHLDPDGRLNDSAKYYAFTVVPLADLKLNT